MVKTTTLKQAMAFRRPITLSLIPISLLVLQGCILSTVVDVATETVETGVELTGTAIGTAVDVVTPDGEDAD